MNTYDFRSLNDKDFERIVADLLGAHFGKSIERFKPGKDGGVDGRWFSAEGGEVVLQCKHWVGSTPSALISALERDEAPKVNILKPARYILITSLPLSMRNKKAILEALHPHIKREDDVWGAEDLNDALSRHPEIEKRHYKLWLSSSTVLTAFLNHAIIGRSAAVLEEMAADIGLFVPTKDHQEARNRLREEHAVLVTGEPGIGKTTIARQLVLEHVAKGYELVAIEESISEAESVYEVGKKQIFYFDDFLGSTYLESLRAKQDSHVATFLARIGRDSTKRFVLTSRTNILNQGATLSESVNSLKVGRTRHEVVVSNMNLLDRAHILYNHLWHGTLDKRYIDELYVEERYRAVIGHSNFNPRLVAFILDPIKVADRAPAEYWKYVTNTLRNPVDLWGHFFEAQITQESRDIVCLLVVAGGGLSEAELRAGFGAIEARKRQHPGALEQAFRTAIRHSVGAVANRHLPRATGPATYTLFNPSLADYAARYLTGADLWEPYFIACRTLGALEHLRSLASRKVLPSDKVSRVILSLLENDPTTRESRDRYSLRLAVITIGRRASHESLSEWLTRPDLDLWRTATHDYMMLFMSHAELVTRAEAVVFAETVFDTRTSWEPPADAPEVVKGVFEQLEFLGLPAAVEAVRLKLVDHWTAELGDAVEREDIAAEYTDDDDAHRVTSRVRDFAESAFMDYGIALTEAEVDVVCSEFDPYARIESNRGSWEVDADDGDDRRPGQQDRMDETAAIRDLFDRSM